jgi:hypothetical protein
VHHKKRVLQKRTRQAQDKRINMEYTSTNYLRAIFICDACDTFEEDEDKIDEEEKPEEEEKGDTKEDEEEELDESTKAFEEDDDKIDEEKEQEE